MKYAMCPWLIIRDRRKKRGRNSRAGRSYDAKPYDKKSNENKKSTKNPCAYIAKDRA